MRSFRLLFAGSLLTCLAIVTQAQVPYPYDPVQDVASPSFQFGSSNIDAIDTDTGLLRINIPLVSYPQRGGILHNSYSISYSGVLGVPGAALTVYTQPISGAMWWVITELGSPSTGEPLPVGPTVYINDNSNNFPTVYTLSVPSGTDESYFEGWVRTSDGANHVIAWINENEGRTVDGSGYYVVGDTVTDSNGVTTSTTVTSGGNATTTMTDPNGNQLSSATGDTMGRVVTSGTGGVTFPGLNGGTFSVGVSSTTTSETFTLPSGGTYTFQFTPTSLPLQRRQTTAQTVLLLTQITLPNHGTISYTYPTTPTGSACGAGSYFPVLSRTLNANDGTGNHVWQYSYNPSQSGTGTTTVTDPLGNVTKYTYGLNSCNPYPTQIQRSDNKGNVLQTETFTYSYVQPVLQLLNVNLTSDTIAWANGKTEQKSYTYDVQNNTKFTGSLELLFSGTTNVYYLASASFGYTNKPWSETETDYGSAAPGPVLRKTNTTFSAFSGPNSSLYFGNNILTKPYTVQILNGSGTQVANAIYGYDGASLGSSGIGATEQHEISPPAGNYRGNLTSVSRWLNSGTLACPNGNSGGSNSYVISTATYFDTGELQTAAEPCGDTTTYGYSSTYWGTYPATVTNALNQITSYSYDFNTGLKTSKTDPNNQTTSYFYDSTLRLTQVKYPDGGQTTNCFTDEGGSICSPTSPPYRAVTQRLTGTSAGPHLTTTVYDGLGRVSETQVSNDPSCPTVDKVDTTYDGLGRVSSVSNPYCSTNDPTYGVTTYIYDALGRACVIIPPAGPAIASCQTGAVPGAVVTAYVGRAQAVYDEGNGSQSVERISESDALGRLTSVCEVTGTTLVGQNSSPGNCVGADGAATDITGTGFTTTYNYTPLNDLFQVNQGTMAARMFNHDSLSRLVSAYNPESGTTGFAYDPNDNLLTKTDARGITTTYAYDALDRLTQKSYSDGITPTATFVYDVANMDGFGPFSNPVGRLVKATVGVCNSTYNEYDAMGRTTTQLVYLPVSCVVGQPDYVISYTYDLMGHMTQFANGLFNTFTYAYDGAGRQFRLADASNPTKPLLSGACSSGSNVGACFNPLGEITSDTLGDGETETWNYDTRGRVTSFSAVLNNTAIYSFANTYAPNGNVLTSNDSVNNNWTYSYDQFNRLVGSTKNGSAVAYIYDRFGNRWQESPGGFIATFTGNNPTSPQNNNRIDGYTYDAAGNLLSDGVNTYTYDAENRMITFSNTAGSSGTYVYDAFGVRVQKTTPTSVNNECSGAPNNGGPVYYLHDLSGQISVYSANGNNQCKDEIFAGSRHLAEYSVTPYYFHNDWLGTQRVRSSTSGIAETCQSGVFGENMQCNVSNYDSPLHFTSQQRDAESGNDYFGARYYGSNSGRFMSPDPVGGDIGNPQTLNRYAYVINDPLNRIDAFGLQDTICTGTGPGPYSCSVPNVPLIPPSSAVDLVGPTAGPAPPVELDSGSLSDLGNALGNSGGQPGVQQAPASGGNSGLDAAQLGLGLVSLVPGAGIPANLANAGISLYRGNYGQAALDVAFAIPFVGTVGELGELGEEGFRSFRAFKGAYGAAGEGMQWHHIVEQGGMNLERFGPEAIHNIENLVTVPTAVHREISGFYSSIQDFSQPQTVRQWLRPQSFEAQRDFGLRILRQYGLIP